MEGERKAVIKVLGSWQAMKLAVERRRLDTQQSKWKSVSELPKEESSEERREEESGEEFGKAPSFRENGGEMGGGQDRKELNERTESSWVRRRRRKAEKNKDWGKGTAVSGLPYDLLSHRKGG